MSKKIETYRKYYLLLSDGQEVIDYKIPYGEHGRTTWNGVYDGDVVKVLGPVPSAQQVKELMRLAKIGMKHELSRRNANDKVLRRLKTKTL